MRKFWYLASVLCLIFVCSCASVSSMKKYSMETGKTMRFNANYEAVKSATESAIIASGLEIEEFYDQDEFHHVIIAQKRLTGGSYGEFVRVVIQPSDKDETVVRVITKRKVAMNVTAKSDYSYTIYSYIDKFLESDENYESRPTTIEESWASLKKGMNKNQVLDLFGDIPPSFSSNQDYLKWEYPFGTVTFIDCSGGNNLGGTDGKLDSWELK